MSNDGRSWLAQTVRFSPRRTATAISAAVMAPKG